MITGSEPINPIVNSGGFPSKLSAIYFDGIFCTGITIRQHFAAMAMQGLCANSIPGSHNKPEEIAKEAVRIADATIAALNNSNTKE